MVPSATGHGSARPKFWPGLDGGSWLLAGLDAVYQVVHGASPLPSRLRLAAELLVANRIRPPRTLTALGIDKLCQICNFIRYISTWKKFLILVTS